MQERKAGSNWYLGRLPVNFAALYELSDNVPGRTAYFYWFLFGLRFGKNPLLRHQEIPKFS